MSDRPRLHIIGPVPPPYHEQSIALDILLHSRLQDEFDVTHIDLAVYGGDGQDKRRHLHAAWSFMRQWLRLWRLLFIRRPRAVYLALSETSTGFIRDSLLIWPSVLLGARIVTHLHGGAFREWYESRWSPMRAYVRCVLRTVTRMIVVGESLRSILTGLLPDEKIAVVPNGVEIHGDDRDRDQPDRARPWRVLHLGTLNRLKGTLVLLAAIPTILRHRKDVAFIFGGTWSDPLQKQVAEWYIEQHRLQPYVTFVGELAGSEREASLHSADLFVFPGIQQEGQPMVVLEAMAAGLPIVYTNQGCLRETVINGECGIEAYSEDPYDLAMRICILLDHPEDQRQFGRNASRRCRLYFNKDRHIERMIRVFHDSLAETSPTPGATSLGTSRSR
jgi:glycosyltransferase involved in cell wall biosynthesis